ncbi:selenide, water dikinase SelD [Pseudooceanicola sp. MF1-13]|uniref:selenide, water dikinase SelD n=1 Tax=Pseudooceanicola sp. MF1-13 TaxID=3379095 RepID=UPI003892A246
MQTQIPLTRDIVLIGGGHAHALVLRMWGMAPVPGVRLTVIDPRPVAPYTGMLPGHVAGHYTADEIGIDLVRLCRFAGARLILEAAEDIDLAAKTVIAGGRRIAYDILSIDIGITGDLPKVQGFSDHGTPVKPFVRFAEGWDRFLASGGGQASVIGNGLGGVELALAMAHQLGPDRVRVIGGNRVAHVGDALNDRLMQAMDQAGVALIDGRVAAVGAGSLRLTDGTEVPSTFTVGAAGATPQPWLRDTGLPLTDGFITVGDTLQVIGHDSVFAAGDCAHLSHAPRPKAGVYAVRAAQVLFRNLRASATGGAMRSFRPQSKFLRLVSLGGKKAVAERWPGFPIAPSGRVIWRWKDNIDRKFMRKLTDLPVMAQDRPENPALGVSDELGQAPLCAGCGAKVGPGVLGAVVEGLQQPPRDDVLTGPGDDAGVLQIGGQRQVLTTDHLRAFTDDPAVMARIAAHHALGDVRAMGAKPQSALAQIILPRASAAVQSRMLTEVMQAAGEVFSADGAVILGGHTTMGAEMTIGFTVTGLCDADPITVGGAKAGDVLILTGQIGSGVLLAAEMQGKARGADIAALWEAMAAGPGDIAPLNVAHAMTDVTGFGLAGHLMAICRASGVAAAVDVGVIPFYDGAVEMSEKGVQSTLYPANASNAPLFGELGATEALLHDPQTAGGFLAAVDPNKADAIVKDLRARGVTATVIGSLSDGPPSITLRS